MFICNACHLPEFGTAINDAHFHFDRGKCERCGMYRRTADCHCPTRVLHEYRVQAHLIFEDRIIMYGHGYVQAFDPMDAQDRYLRDVQAHNLDLDVVIVGASMVRVVGNA